MFKNLLVKAWSILSGAFKRSFDADRFTRDLIEDILALRPDLYGSPTLFSVVMAAVAERLSEREYFEVWKAAKVMVIMRGGVRPEVPRVQPEPPTEQPAK